MARGDDYGQHFVHNLQVCCFCLVFLDDKTNPPAQS